MNFKLHHGDARDVLRRLPDEYAQCVVTSPPYWRHRDYGVDGQLGREATPQEYVDHLVGILREVRRVLHRRGVLWLNLGDTYISNKMGNSVAGIRRGCLVGIPWRVALALLDDGWILRSGVIWWKVNGAPEPVTDRPTATHEDLFMLTRGTDYYYDQDAIRETYAESTLAEMKREYRGESKKDYAGAGVQDPSAMKRRIIRGMKKQQSGGFGRNKTNLNDNWHADNGGPNRRDVWPLPTQPSVVKHFALMAPAVAERCILASSRPAGRHCDCHEIIRTPTGRGDGAEDPTETVGAAGFFRPANVDEGVRPITRRQQRDHALQLRASPHLVDMREEAGSALDHYMRLDRAGARPIPQELLEKWAQRGWIVPELEDPTCEHAAGPPDIVLDPFAGASTTGVAALRLGRRFVGIELNEEYVKLSRSRVNAVARCSYRKERKMAKTGQQPLTDENGEPISPLHTLAVRYAAARDRRLQANKAEVAAKERLIAQMRKQETKFFEGGGVEITLTDEPKVQVTVDSDAKARSGLFDFENEPEEGEES